jgi:hypothetical protein
MDVRRPPRAVFNLWLSAVRLPIDLASKVLPNGDRGPRNAATLFIDRADATIRNAAGRAFGDDVLQEEALRRRAATDERARAIRIRTEAAEKQREADAKVAERQRQADNRREQARRDAEARKREIDQDRRERKGQVRQAVAKQENAVRQARDAKVDKVESQAKRDRLGVLEETSEALDREAKALTAADEAKRLRDAAAKTKERRKQRS